jgi:carbon monoxide dehydrogenase subunit G
MKFSKREDIEAPADTVFRAVSDFHAFERAAMRRGIEVARRDEMELPGPGMAWAVRAPVRGRIRDIAIRLTRWQPDQSMYLAADSGGLVAAVEAELVELSRNRTRLQVGLELRAVTMTSKLFLQSLRLAKGTLDRRFAKRVWEFAREVEDRHQRGAKTA